jgi:bifunctional aspartokinase / homoserine dehydrogenase 1
MATLTMKFGGASVGTTTALSQVLSIIIHESKRWDRVLIVASALEGVTDMLLEAAQLAQLSNQRGYRRIVATLRTRHMALIEQLPLGNTERVTLQADVDRLLFDMLDLCQTVASNLNDELSPRVSDSIVSVGERLSARIIAALLRQNDLRGIAVDGTDILITDDVYGNAMPDLPLTAKRVNDILLPMLDRGIIPVVTGYIGATVDGVTTTLGRGGTDYTASVLSALINAEELWIWTDVEGMMSSDPREIPEAHVIKELNYNEVAELAYFGAKILHARMIVPLRERSLPLRIKNVFKPQETGTLVSHYEHDEPPSIKAVTSIQGLALTRPASGSTAGIVKMVGNTLFKTLGMRIEVMISSQSSNSSFICLVIPTSVGIDGVDRLQDAIQDKMSEYPEKMPWDIETISIVTAIGNNLNRAPSMMANVLEQLETVQIFGLAMGPSNCSISVAISTEDTHLALDRIHQLTIKSD